MKKVKLKVISLVFVLMISSLGLSFLLPDKTFSKKENRPLKQFPEFNAASFLSGDFQQEYESYLNDQLIGKDMLHSLKMKVDLLMGQHQFDDVIVGKEDLLFQTFEPLTTTDIQNKAKSMNQFIEKYPKLKYSILLIPNKIAIYEELLPNHYPKSQEEFALNQFLDNLDSRIQKSDILTLFQQNKEKTLYYSSDHHWTTQGAFLTFQQWLKDQGLSELEQYQHYISNDHFIGSLANRSGYSKSKDQIEIYLPEKDIVKYTVHYVEENIQSTSLYDLSHQQSNDPYAVFLGGNHPRIDISTNVTNRNHLLLLKDSYANCMIQFLLPYYSEITIIDPRYYYDDLDLLMEERQISDVLFLYNANTFFHDDSLMELLK